MLWGESLGSPGTWAGAAVSCLCLQLQPCRALPNALGQLAEVGTFPLALGLPKLCPAAEGTCSSAAVCGSQGSCLLSVHPGRASPPGTQCFVYTPGCRPRIPSMKFPLVCCMPVATRAALHLPGAAPPRWLLAAGSPTGKMLGGGESSGKAPGARGNYRAVCAALGCSHLLAPLLSASRGAPPRGSLTCLCP